MIKLNLIYIKNNKTKYIQDFENVLIKRMNHLIDINIIPLSHKKKFSSNKESIDDKYIRMIKELIHKIFQNLFSHRTRRYT